MPFDRCIAAALADQQITLEQHGEYQRIYGEELNARSASMPPNEAAAEAARETFRQIEEDAAERRRQTFLSLAVRQDLAAQLDGFVNPRTGQADPWLAAIGFYDRLLPGRRGFAVEQQHQWWLGQAHARLNGAFTTWSRNFLGQRRNQPGFANIVREAFGQNTGDAAARALIDGWREASTMLRQAFNRFGGHIGELEDWGMPQAHNRAAVAAVPFEQWREFVVLDRARMRTRNGARPMSDAELDTALRGVYQGIVTQGWDTRAATAAAGGRALANRFDEHRFLHFATPDDWFRYQERFGEGDPINAMLTHIERMSRAVGLMQVMGPNPNATLAWLKNELTRRAALLPVDQTRGQNSVALQLRRNDARAVRSNDTLDKLHANYTRSNAAPTRPIVADVLHDVNNVLMGAQLGSAVVPAFFGDINTQRVTRTLAGMPEVEAISSYFHQLRSSNNRQAAIRAGLTAQHYAKTLTSQGRFSGELFGHPWSQWINDRVQWASGLTAWTSAGRSGFAMDFYGHVADMREVQWGVLPDAMRNTLESFNIGQHDWNIMRSTAPVTDGGVTFIRPGDIFNRTDITPGEALSVASKLADVAMTLSEHAVPSGSLRAQASIRGLDKPGSARAAIVGSLAMYRTFASVMLLSHGRRLMELGRINPRRAASYAAGLVVGGMFAGAMAIQAREVAQGRDPRDMTDWRFWLAAMSAGGGLGLLGDFAYAGLAGESRTGNSFGTMFVGPPIGLAIDTKNLVVGRNPLGPTPKHESPQAANLPTRMLQFGKRYTPGSNIWYSRLVMERLVWDHLQAMVDPGWSKRVQGQERMYRRNYGNDFWWRPGDDGPEGAPDLNSALGGGR